MLYAPTEDSDRAIAEALGRIAEERGTSRAQIALAWVLRNPVVTTPIVGVSKPRHISDAVAALEIDLTDEEAARLEASYTPRRDLQRGSSAQVVAALPGTR
jgi:aryl-alcohol dehydrogenase-like predicted oxidoreductase